MADISSIMAGRHTAGPSRTVRNADPAEEKKLRKVCADFEAMLAFQLIKTMRQTVPGTGFLKRSQAQQTYEMMLDQKMAEELAGKAGGLGLQQILYNQMIRHPSGKELKSLAGSDDTPVE